MKDAINRGDVASVKSLLQGEDASIYSQEICPSSGTTLRSELVELAVTQIVTPTCNTRLLYIRCCELKALFATFPIPKELQLIILSSYLDLDITPRLQILRLLTRPSIPLATYQDNWETTPIRYSQEDTCRTKTMIHPEWIKPLFQCNFAPDVIHKIIVICYNLSDRSEGISPDELNYICTTAALYKSTSWMLYAARNYNFALLLKNLKIPDNIKGECIKTITPKPTHKGTLTNLSTLENFVMWCGKNCYNQLLFTAATSVGKIFSTIFETLALGLGYVVNTNGR